MSDSLDRISLLLFKQLKGEASEVESAELRHWEQASPANAALADQIRKGGYVSQGLQELSSAQKKTSELLKTRGIPVNETPKTIITVRRVHFLQTAWFRYGAAVILLTFIGSYLWKTSTEDLPRSKYAHPVANRYDILPGSNKATLTLGDGQQINLGATSDSMLIKKGIINHHALISYSGATETNSINTLSTPRGGQYKLSLNDGTMVWLNAASSITYPTKFTGSRREVMVTGETYFEVAKNAEKPFIVTTSAGQITALGTQFNVNAYADADIIKTTLIEGSVKIGSSILMPGQAWLNGSITQTDISQDIAWKNGRFNFQDQTLHQIMDQLSRWYDLKVIYEPGIRQMEFGGDIPRNLKLSEVLKVLEGIGIHFSLEEANVLRVKP